MNVTPGPTEQSRPGHPRFDNILDRVASNAPLAATSRNRTWREPPRKSSPLSAVTGQTHVDAGYSITMVPETIME